MMTSTRSIRPLLLVLVSACGSEDSDFHDWAIRHADAVCECVDAEDPRKCVEQMPEELSMTGEHAQNQLIRWKGKGGPKAQANLVRAIDCHRTIKAWGVEHPLPSSAPSVSLSVVPVPSTTAPASASSAPAPSAPASTAPLAPRSARAPFPRVGPNPFDDPD
jgi:hypothetical protein